MTRQNSSTPISSVVLAVAVIITGASAAFGQTSPAVPLPAPPPPGLRALQTTPPGPTVRATVAALTQPRLSAADQAVYTRAFAMFDAADGPEQRTEALRVAATATAPTPRDVLRWRDMLADDTAASFTDITAFIDNHPDWPLSGALRRSAEAQAVAPYADPTSTLPRPAAATVIAWFAAHPTLTGDAAWLYASALQETAATAPLPADIARAAWVDLEFSAGVERRFLDQFAGVLSPVDHDARIRRLLRAGNADAAERMLPLASHDVAALARASIALARRSAGVDRAIAAVPAHLRDDPGLWFERLRWRRRKGFTVAAHQILLDPPVIPDDLGRWARERLITARDALTDGDPATAYALITGHGLTSGTVFADAEFFAGWVQLAFLNDPATAFTHFQTLFNNVRFPISRSRGAYWSARAAQASGDTTVATEWFERAAAFPTTFYGQLALATFGREIPPPVAPPDQSAPAPILDHPFVAIAVELRDAGAPQAARQFLRHLVRTAEGPAEFEAVAALATALGRPTEAMSMAKRAAFHGYTMDTYEFPLLPATILAAAAHPGVEQPLVHGLVRQESTFDSSVVSSAGASGLMQLMPATAERTAKQLGLPYTGTDQLIDDPAYNVTLGQAYLAEMVARYDGTYILALAAYNAGPSRVDRWLTTYGDPRDPAVDAINWVESIPFNETRNYVQRVMEAVPYYRSLLATNPAGGRSGL